MRLCCPVGKHGPVLPFAPTAEDEKGTELRQTARATTPGPAGPGRERRCRTRAWKPRFTKKRWPASDARGPCGLTVLGAYRGELSPTSRSPFLL